MPSPESHLRAFDTLEVGPAQVESNRIRCPYRVVGGRGGATELVYRYEEPVLDPRDPGHVNLASMIGAQLALNYGLFCRRIVFRGPFDTVDRRFLAVMAENTAREIYVNKLLKPNRFLRGPVARLEPRKRERYCAARLEFPDAPPARRRRAPGTASPGGYAILSSGGKESLLSLGLLEELGKPAHPIFVNESGRHWYTALNAHRSLEKSRPHTARVWTTSDRLFGWMLRRLPFIRPDFARVRSDEYPIRLWTVAVFLFGALPVVRSRGLDHVVIGCENDTTRTARHAGIPHYDGLYDQSRRFDDALTRYYRDKGWSIRQLSILRPLSELLIQKTLVERYPQLQRLQVSCHAAHLENGLARPCGKCEKCRRIVALLTAAGADARRCGYTAAQIKSCLAGIEVATLHQEAHDANELVARLRAPGRREASSSRGPGLLAVRFDATRSPVDLLPSDVCADLLRIYRTHGDGSVSGPIPRRTSSSERRPARWSSSFRPRAPSGTLSSRRTGGAPGVSRPR